MTTDFVLTFSSTELKYAFRVSEFDKQGCMMFILLNSSFRRYGKFINAYDVISTALDCSLMKAKFFYKDFIEQSYSDLDKSCVYFDSEPYTSLSNLVDIVYVLPSQWRIKLLHLKIYSDIADYGLKIKKENATSVIV